MRRIFSVVVAMILVGLPAFAQKDENNRIQNAGGFIHILLVLAIVVLVIRLIQGRSVV